MKEKETVVFSTRMEKEDLKKLKLLSVMMEKPMIRIINDLVKEEVKRLKLESIDE